jgi:hypothetical protein
VNEKLADRSGNALTHLWQLLQSFESAPPEQGVQRLSHHPNRRSCTKVCRHAKGIRALVSEQLSRFLQAAGYLFVDPLHPQLSSELFKANGAPRTIGGRTDRPLNFSPTSWKKFASKRRRPGRQIDDAVHHMTLPSGVVRPYEHGDSGNTDCSYGVVVTAA